MSLAPGVGRGRGEDRARALGALVLGLSVLTALAVLPGRSGPRSRKRPKAGSAEASALHGTAAMLSASVLADSAVEHYRGAYDNPGMYTPLLVSALTLATGLDGGLGKIMPRHARRGVYALAGAVGAAGAAFHVYNVLRRPGGLSWQNAFYAAPLGAPAALSLAGAFGLAAEEASAGASGRRFFGMPAGRALSALTSLGLFGTVGEAGLLHFRGSFQNPFMWLPVTLPPVAGALMGKAAVEPDAPRARPLTRLWLAITAVLGLGGVGFHAYGVSRAMGGWRNWSQNLVDGPPLPAPPSFTALALAGLAALSLRDREHD